jgi:hypothetical protein
MLAVEEGDHVRAARLFAAASAADHLYDRALTPGQVVEQRRSLAGTRSALGDATFEAAWAEGQGTTTTQAVADALTEANENAPAQDAPRQERRSLGRSAP